MFQVYLLVHLLFYKLVVSCSFGGFSILSFFHFWNQLSICLRSILKWIKPFKQIGFIYLTGLYKKRGSSNYPGLKKFMPWRVITSTFTWIQKHNGRWLKLLKNWSCISLPRRYAPSEILVATICTKWSSQTLSQDSKPCVMTKIMWKMALSFISYI